jgi:O-Antigen ligase
MTAIAGQSLPKSKESVFSGSIPRALAQGAALCAVGLAPFHVVVYGGPGQLRRGVVFQFVDVALAVLLAVKLPATVRAAFSTQVNRRSVPAAALAVFCALLLSAIVHPFSTMGVATLVRFGGAVALVQLLTRCGERFVGAVAKLWVGVSVVEAMCVLLQRLLGRRIGFPGEYGTPFETLGTFKIPSGTLSGPHPVAALGLVAFALALYGTHHGLIGKAWGLAGAASGSAIVGVTCGTSSALSLFAIFVAAVVASIRSRKSGAVSVVRLLMVAAAVFLATAAWSIDGWKSKADRTATTNIEQAGNGRVGMLKESVSMMKRWPVFGVGPGRFMAERDANPDLKALATEDQPVHNVAMLIVNESGLFGAAALFGLALAVARRVRRHSFSVVVLCAMSGHVLFDHAPWTFGGGMVYLALVLGFVGRERSVQENVAINTSMVPDGNVGRNTPMVSPGG